MAGLHGHIETVQDAAVEVVLKSECATVGKVAHLLRADCDRLTPDELGRWDAEMRCSLGRSLNGELEDVAWIQAMGGFSFGGLGWRTASDLALPAFLASRIAARPAVQLLFDSLSGAGFGAPQQFLDKYDARTLAAEMALRTRLPVLAAQQLDDVLRDGTRETERRWPDFTATAAADAVAADGVAPTVLDPSQQQQPQATQPTQVGGMPAPVSTTADAAHHGSLVRDALAANLDEPGSDRSRHFAGPLQRALSAVQDGVRDGELNAKLESEGRHADLRRLAELRASEDQERSWLWAICRGSEPTISPADYSLAVRAMLGATVLIQPMVCNGCGVRVMDVQGRHALCCMGAATTIGHNRVRDVIAMGLAMADPGTVVEPLGLVPTRPELRPADASPAQAWSRASLPATLALQCRRPEAQALTVLRQWRYESRNGMEMWFWLSSEHRSSRTSH